MSELINIADTLNLDIEAELAAIEAAAQEQAETEAAIEAAKPKKEKKAKAPAVVTEATEDEAVVIPHVAGVLKDLVSNLAPEALVVKQAEVIAAFESRLAFEEAQVSVSEKMRDNLKTASARLASPALASILSVLDIDMRFVNREVSRGSRFNVYALQKVVDLVAALSSGIMGNAVNRAVVTSMFMCKEAGMPFNGDLALAAVSDKIRIEPRFAKNLARHTVSQNTASTQKSSTMNALEVLGIATTNHLKGAAEIFTLTDTPQTRRLEEVLMRT